MPKVIVFGNTLVNTMGLIRSIGEKGIPVILMLEPCRKNHCYVRFSRYVKKVHWLQKMEDALDVLRNEYWNESLRPIILCGSDPSICLLDSHYAELKEHFCIFNANGEQGRINHFMDKVNQFPIAEQSGLKLIKTWCVDDGSNLPSDITYPCLIKGGNSVKSTKGDMFICRDENELRANLHEGVQYLIQEYIEKDYELDIVGLSCNHGNSVYIPAVVRKIRDTLHRQSVFIRLDNISDYADFNPQCVIDFVRGIGYEGIFSVEVICRKGEYYFLEINLRNDACGYLYTAAGVNYPYLWLLYSMGFPVKDYIENIKCNTPFFFMQENDLYNLLEGKVSFRYWIKDFLRSGAFFVMNWRDPLPFIVSTLIHGRQACKKILGLIRYNVA